MLSSKNPIGLILQQTVEVFDSDTAISNESLSPEFDKSRLQYWFDEWVRLFNSVQRTNIIPELDEWIDYVLIWMTHLKIPLV